MPRKIRENRHLIQLVIRSSATFNNFFTPLGIGHTIDSIGPHPTLLFKATHTAHRANNQLATSTIIVTKYYLIITNNIKILPK